MRRRFESLHARALAAAPARRDPDRLKATGT
jgi:hypothetical protein